MGLPFLPFAALIGPAHRAMSYEPFSRMAGAAPRAARSLRGHFVGMLSGLRCCLAPGDTPRLILLSGLPVEGRVAATGGLSFDQKPKPVLQSRHRVRCAVVHKVLTPDDV